MGIEGVDRAAALSGVSSRTAMASLVRRIALGATLFVLLAGGMTAYVALPVARDLRAARTILSRSQQDLQPRDLVEAANYLESAGDRLRSLPGRLIRVVPIVRQNVSALEDVTHSATAALQGGADLFRTLKRRSFIDDAGIDTIQISSLAERASAAADALARLQRALENRSGWLIPNLWYSLGSLEPLVQEMRSDADKAVAILRAGPNLLGASRERTYLVLLMNNAESRGSGGILSGLGTISVRGGRFKLGPLDYRADLAQRLPRIERVASPSEFRARYGLYKADTTLFVNATMSPDVPDVALVLSRLYRKVTGIATDGAVLLDPLGVAALLPPRTRVAVPGVKGWLSPSELPEFVYSRAYEVFEGSNPRRREALLNVAKVGLSALTSGTSLRSVDASALAAAVHGGHLRFVSFDRDEDSLLSRAALDGDLVSSADDSVFVTTQNFGADKLDYWAERTVRHSCRVREAAPAHCTTEVRLLNGAPKGLPDYVTQDKPRATLETFLEIYVPVGARITDVSLNGKPVAISLETEDQRLAAGVYVEIPRGKHILLRAAYDLDLQDSHYTLEMTPQPLARSARVEVRLQAPSGWDFRQGPGTRSGTTLRYAGPFERRLVFEAAPVPTPSGIPALWERIKRFWNNPVTLGG